MNITDKLPELRKRSSLPVSIPINIYHQTLSMASANSCPKNFSKEKMSKPNEQRENLPKKANMITKNKESTDKSTLTDFPSGSTCINETITIDSPEVGKCKCKNGEFTSNHLFLMFLNNFVNIVRQKNTIHVNKSTQTDDVPNLSQEDKLNNEELKAKSQDTQLKKGTDTILNDVENYSQEYKEFFVELCSSAQKLFKENSSNNKRTFQHSQGTRRTFLNITKYIIDLITREEKGTEDFSSGANVAEDIVNLEVDNNNRESSENIVSSVVNNNNNNKETSHTQTQTAQNIIQQNDLPDVQENNNVQKEQLDIEQTYLQQYAPNVLVPRDLQTLQTPPTPLPVSNETPYEHHQRSNVEWNFSNNAFNPQSTARYTRTPRPQMTLYNQQQLINNGGNIYDYQNKMLRFSTKHNVRSPYYHQKPQKRKTGQQQGFETIPPFPIQNYPTNQQQFIQQPYQQNLH